MALSVPFAPAEHASSRRGSLTSQVLRALSVVESWLDRIEQRHSLRHLPDATLRDVGLTRADADREADKPFWEA